MIQIVIFAWLATVFVESDIQLHPMTTDDVNSIVESLKKDVDRHFQLLENLKLTNKGQTSEEESAVASKPLTEKDAHSKRSDEHSSDDGSEFYYGSVKGRPGVDFPDYTDIPKTSFTCSDKNIYPGFYADMDTGCQVFHVCWPDRRESFLCPMGTIFNQADLTCDYWYNSDCSQASFYYTMQSESKPDSTKTEKVPIKSAPVQKSDSLIGRDAANSVVFFVSEFMPIKAKIVLYPKSEKQRPKTIATTSIGESNAELKVKSRKKTHKSKHSRVPRSAPEHEISSSETLDKLKDQILFYRTWEAVNNAVIEIQNNKSTAHLLPYAERIEKFFKYWILKETLPVTNIEPGSELYEYDMDTKNVSKIMYSKLVHFIAGVLHDFDFDRYEREKNRHEVSQDDDLEISKAAPLTNLNPRFIVKPTARDTESGELDESSSFTKERVKRAATTQQFKQSQDDPVRIYPETKAALLKSYVELYEAKRA